MNQESGPRGNPLEPRGAKRSFRCRFTHLFAKGYVFNLCVGVFKKNTNTQDARTLHCTTPLPCASSPVFVKNLCQTKSNNFCFLYLPLVVSALEHRIKRAAVFLLLFFEERQCQGESKGERLGSLSFAISLWNDKEMA